MKLSKAEIEHLASLTRIELTEDEKEKLAEQLSDILSYMEMIGSLAVEGEVGGIEERGAARFRLDEPSTGLSFEELIRLGKPVRQGHLVAPRVIRRGAD